jgi:parallel beta-helix repeat protein
LSNNETGIWIEESNNNTITGNVFQSNGLRGICVWNSMYNIIAENQVLSNGGEGIYVFSASERNIIKGNLISSNNGNGIWIDACSLQIISGNFIYGNQGVAILANYSNHLVITGNNILENGKAGTGLISGAADIWIIDSVYCNISNNICYIPVPGPDYGIRESNTSDYNIISGNFVDGYKIKIGLVGLNSKSFGNIEL